MAFKRALKPLSEYISYSSSLCLDSKDFITDLDELIKVYLIWNGSFLGLGEVEL